MEIVPAILTDDPQELKNLINQCEGVVERVQIDIVDGIFAANKTIDPQALEYIDTDLLIDYQLMVKEPVSWVERCVRGKGDRIFGHVEMMTKQIEFIEKVQQIGLSVGLALDLGSPVEKIDSFLITNLDAILVMSVKAGFGGQNFESSALEKVKKLGAIKSKDQTPFKICVDGGILPKHVKKLARSGADELAIGKKLFVGSLEENIKIYIKG